MPFTDSPKDVPRVHWTRSRARAAASPPNAPPQPTSPILAVTALPNPPAHPSSSGTSEIVNRRTVSLGHLGADDNAEEDAIIKAFRRSFLAELGGSVYVVDKGWAQSLYRDVVPHTLVDEFLSSPASGYVRGRWASIPRSAHGEKELSRAVARILTNIVQKCGGSEAPGVSRAVFDNLAVGFKDPRYAFACPAISGVATGPSFEKPLPNDHYTDGVGFSNLASTFDVMLDKAEWDEAKQATQGALYARQVFARQPNRNFFRTLIITESRVRLVHYDRSGAFMTPFINIHDDPHTFVRLVVGLTSTDETVVGLDTSVQWKVDAGSGRRVSGTLEALDSDGSVVHYCLHADQRPFSRMDIIGRGTTCWRATHPKTGAQLLVKEAWRPDAKRSEAEFLSSADGVAGVAQMVSSHEHLSSTRSLRPATFEATKFTGRIKSRVVMERYEESVDKYTSRKQAIGALRDALFGYLELLRRSILHRDISFQNILLGPPNASPGKRGALIDFDMAVWLSSEMTEQMNEFPVGTRRFQSIALNRLRETSIHPPHDPLDDLESFFWVFSHLVVGYTTPGVQSSNFDFLFQKFDDDSSSTSSAAKIVFLFTGYDNSLSPWWGKPCETLMRGFLDTMFEIHTAKCGIRQSGKFTPQAKFDQLVELGKGYEKYFERVLKLFDDALLEIEEEDEVADVATPASPLPAPAPPSPLKPAANPTSPAPPSAPPAATTPLSPARPIQANAHHIPTPLRNANPKRSLEEAIVTPPPPKRARKGRAPTKRTARAAKTQAEPPKPRRSSRRVASKST